MAYQGFDISEFKSVALRRGIAKKNLYLARLSPISGLSWNLMFFTDGVNLPTIDLDTMQIRRYGYGPSEAVPFRPVFAPLQMTFIVENSQRNVITQALSSISSITQFMNYDTMQDNIVNSRGVLCNPYEVGYKGGYEFDVEVFVYNEIGDTIIQYVFRNCFIKNIRDIQLGWNQNDQYMQVGLTFNYTDYSITSLGNPLEAAASNLINGVVNTLQTDAYNAINIITSPFSAASNALVNLANAGNILSDL